MLQAPSEVDPDKAARLLDNWWEVYHVPEPVFEELVKATWMGLSDAAKTRVRANERRGHDEYADLLRQKVETFANDPGSQRPSCPQLDCELELLATRSLLPIGTVGTVIPVETAAESGIQASAAFGWDDPVARSQLTSVGLTAPVSAYLQTKNPRTGALSRFAMTPTKAYWDSIVATKLKPLQRHCRASLRSLAQNPIDENISAAGQALASLGGFYVKTHMMFEPDVSQLRPQRTDEPREDLEHSKSRWKFPLPGNGSPSFNPPLTAFVKPVPGLNCVPSDSVFLMLPTES
jgi:hypothetical protein